MFHASSSLPPTPLVGGRAPRPGQKGRKMRPGWSGPVLGEPLFLDSDITPEHRLLQCVRPSLSNLEHYSGRNVGAVMFQVRQQKSKGLAQTVFRKTTSGNQPTAGPDHFLALKGLYLVRNGVIQDHTKAISAQDVWFGSSDTPRAHPSSGTV